MAASTSGIMSTMTNTSETSSSASSVSTTGVTVGISNGTNATDSVTSSVPTTANVSTSTTQVNVTSSLLLSSPTSTVMTSPSTFGLTNGTTSSGTNGSTATNATSAGTVPTNATATMSTGTGTNATTVAAPITTPPTKSSSTTTATSSTPTTTTSTVRSTTAVATTSSSASSSASTTTRTSTTATPTVTTSIPTTTLLPTVAPFFVRYPVSSDYYFPDMATGYNTTSTADLPLQSVTGPFGFGQGLKVNSVEQSCVSTSGVYQPHDLDCLKNPSKCFSGISVSIWEYANFDVKNTVDKYIVSSGGNEAGGPGISMFHRGVDLHAVVSNGTHTWSVYAPGPVPNNTWTNIGMRWNYSSGLEVYVDQEKVASVVYPSASAAPAQPFLDPPEIAVGCQIINGNPRSYANFSDSQFDELAVWMRGLNATELPYFMGGYDPIGANMSVDDIKKIISSKLDLSDPEQNKQAVDLLRKKTQDMTATFDAAPTAASSSSSSSSTTNNQQSSGPTASPTSGNQNTTNNSSGDQPTGPSATDGGYWLSNQASSASASKDESLQAQVDNLQSISDIVNLMTDPSKIKKNMSADEMSAFQDLIGVVSNMFSPDRKSEWNKIQKTKRGSPDVVKGLRIWAVAQLQQMVLPGKPRVFSSTKTTDSIVLSTAKMTVQDYKDKKGVCIPDYSDPAWDSVPWVRGTPKLPYDTVQLPRELFQSLNRNPNSNIFVASYLFSTFDDIAPLTVNPDTLPSERVFLDSKVITIDMEPNKDLAVPLYRSPLVITLAHNHRETALRQLLFHDENQTIPTIKSRYCARWNPNLIPRGGWDSSRCEMYHSSEEYSVCYCEQLGSYAILAQNIERRLIYPDPLWLTILKYTFYGLSIVLLIIYILIIIFSKHLKDQFHIIRLNMAFTVLAGTGCMLATDFVRGERHECTAVTAVMHFSYASVGCWLLVEAHALFAAIQYGIIGGKLKAYFPFAYGCPMLLVGLAFLGGFQDYGLEPRCMVSWNDTLKWTLFAPNLIFGGCGILLAAATIINTSFAALKKEHIFEDLGSVSWGLFAVVVTFSFNWVFACLAYLDIELMSPDFYPIFQVLNAGLGFMIFLFMGLGSKRFRIVARGGKPDSRHFPLMNQKDSNLVPVKPQPKQKKGPLQG